MVGAWRLHGVTFFRSSWLRWRGLPGECCSGASGRGNPDDYIVGLSLAGVDAAVAQARDYLRSVGYRARGWPLS
jgi:hypothetical protein